VESTLAPPKFALPANAVVSDKFRFWLDEPASWDGTARRVRLSGWCVARKGEPLRKIRARIGRAVVERTFDRERPEVAEYLGESDVPRWCGFAMQIELPPGQHRLELEAASDNNKWREVFAGDVLGPAKDSRDEPPRIDADRFDAWFDHPTEWSEPANTLYIIGWCVDRSGAEIRGIRARTGDVISRGRIGDRRDDVAAAYPYNDHALYSGFAIAAALPAGSAECAVEARCDDGWRVIARHPVFGDPAATSAPEDELLAQLCSAPPSRFRFWVDPPDDWSKPHRYLHLSGWCFAVAGEEVSEVRARIGRTTFRAYYGIPRPDVAAAYERRAGSLRTGFEVDVVVPWGRHTIVLEALSQDGEWEPFFEQRVRGRFAWHREDTESEIGNYPAWIRQYDTLTRADRKWIGRDIEQFGQRPLFSILMPVYNPAIPFLRRAISSVRAQLYPHWQLCIVDDASTDPAVSRELERWTRRDKRIVARRHENNEHISATSNDALALATGEFIALLDQDDELAETPLYFAARELNCDPRLRLIYTDEDKLDAHGRRCDPHFKPDWNPDLFTSQNYISHLAFYATDLVRSVGGFRRGFEGAQDYDLTLRCIEKIAPAEIRHIPHVLYHWRASAESAAGSAEAKPYAIDAAARAVQEHFDRCAIAANVEPARQIYHRARYSLPADPPLVSIVIPTRDRRELLERSVESILAKTDYPQFELIVVDNESREPEAIEYLTNLARHKQVRVLPSNSTALTSQVSAGEFNFSKLNNLGVSEARGEIVALVNNDIEVINSDWLREMVSDALRPEIGAVGARLRYPNGTIQHAGVILGAGGIGNHAHIGLRDEPGYFSRAHLIQNFSAVTAACMVLRKRVYEQVGGLDELNLAVAFNDVDFCLRIVEAGYRIVYTPYAELIHYESSSRGFEDTHEKRARFLAENEFMHRKWRDKIENDPAYNPNLSLGAKLFALASPPRVKKPWQSATDGK
jgi:glycosyltransferase involved in cell wall biosynthesis